MSEMNASGGAVEATQSSSGDHATQDSDVPQAVADKFAEVFGGGSEGSGEAQATAQSQASQSEADELEEARVAAESAKTGSDETPVVPATKTVVTKPANEEATATLDPVLKHAAKRAGWSDEEIKEAIELNPDAATRAFTKLHGSYNDLSERFAQLGQPRQPQQQPVAQPVAQPTDPFAALDALFKPEALKEFADNNGEELVEKFLKPLYGALAPIKQIQAQYQAAQQESLSKEVGTIFKGWEGDFADIYGSGHDLTADQLAARGKVGQLADQITAGAAAQGIQLPVSEALERAHAYLTKDRAAEVARKQVTSKVQGRAGKITARPTQRKTANTVGDGAAKSEESAQNAVKSFWAERGM
jgi:hypothetical protein